MENSQFQKLILDSLKEINSGLATVQSQVNNLDNKVSAVQTQVNNLDEKVSALDVKVNNLDEKVGALDVKVSNLDKKVGALDVKVNNLDDNVSAIDFKVSALIEHAYRKANPPCEHKEVRTVADATSLLTKIDTSRPVVKSRDEFSIGDLSQYWKNVVKSLYKNGTRNLFHLICPDAEITNGGSGSWEKEAHAALTELKNSRKGKKCTSEVSEFQWNAQEKVLNSFITLLDPFSQNPGMSQLTGEANKKKALNEKHESAMQKIMNDSSGLSLSLIMAHETVQHVRGEDASKHWAWDVLEIDGYAHTKSQNRDGEHREQRLTEIKGSPANGKKAKKQLLIRAAFLDVVASMMEYKHTLEIKLVAAFLKGPDQDQVEGMDTKELKFRKTKNIDYIKRGFHP